ncbi:tumor necrosis factor receptor superfamily member 14-like [Myotis yumanensis]|uniref:tumor necrosis factor receptor superfamily member 14-like n=1 Tax=Myotis yumanensis TaxID=159337 RepID=UPI0038D198F9
MRVSGVDMQPLPGWGPPPCSPTPSADVLRLLVKTINGLWRQTVTLCSYGCGHFCERQDGDSCVQCRPHSVCRPGQRVRETGTKWQDTLCEDCQPGTFSAGGTQAACTPWTRKTHLSWDIAACAHPGGDRKAGRKEQASGPAGLPGPARRHHGARGGDSIPVPSERLPPDTWLRDAGS